MKTDKQLSAEAEELRYQRAVRENAKRGLPAPPKPGEEPRGGVDRRIIAVHPPAPAGKLNDPTRGLGSPGARWRKPAAQVDAELEAEVARLKRLRATMPYPIPATVTVPAPTTPPTARPRVIDAGAAGRARRAADGRTRKAALPADIQSMVDRVMSARYGSILR